MPELIMTLGLPGSGKTTYALALLAAAEPGTLTRVNRDCLRDMVHGRRCYWSSTEDQVTVVQDAAIAALLDSGVSVVVDDTNLKPSTRYHLRELAWHHGATFRTEPFTHVPLETCVARNARRTGEELVPETYIRQAHADYVSSQITPGRGAMNGTRSRIWPLIERFTLAGADVWIARSLLEGPFYRGSVTWVSDRPGELMLHALKVLQEREEVSSRCENPNGVRWPTLAVLVPNETRRESAKVLAAIESLARRGKSRGVTLVLVSPTATAIETPSERESRLSETPGETLSRSSENPSETPRSTDSRSSESLAQPVREDVSR